MNTPDKIIEKVEHWVRTIVVGLNLCPFAQREIIKNRVRYTADFACTEEESLIALEIELRYLVDHQEVETTLLILPNAFPDFFKFNQFLNYVDGLLEETQLIGIIQIATFHPHYQFADTAADDVENYTNRSPYPILHLLREDSLEKAIKQYPDADQIPDSNITLLRNMGKSKLIELLSSSPSPNKK